MELCRIQIVVPAILAIFCEQNFSGVQSSPGSSTENEDIVERFENILKPPNDSREYRGLILKNRLKVLLVSDPSAEKCAASMTTGVGSLNDFRDVLGLTNLVGYALAIGSKTFPRPYGFKKFVEARGGKADPPVTVASMQHFSFDIDPTYFRKALDRFAKFFIEPLLSYEPKPSLREAFQYVNLLYTKESFSDASRIALTEKGMSKENHPFRHPVFGNPDIYNWPERVLHDNIRTFHSTWYSSNIMTLAVLGRENLNELEKIVVSLFKMIEDKNARPFRYSYKYHPWGPEQLKRKLYVKPLAESLQALRLKFPVPDVHDSGAGPHHYITTLMVHNGPGSLFSQLRNKGLCTDFVVEYNHLAGVAFLTIICDLTNEGLTRVDEIVYLIFQYVHLLKEEGIQEHYFTELKILKEVEFLNWTPSEDQRPLALVQTLTANMQSLPFEKVAYHREVVEWNPELLREFLCYLRPDNMIITVVSRSSIELVDPVTNQAKFACESIPDELIEKWSTNERFQELRLPTRNEFVPESFTVYPIGETEPKYPYVIHQSPKSEIWFKQDDQFRIPEIRMQFELISSLTLSTSPFEYIFWRVLFIVLKSLLKLHFYSAPLVEIKWVNWDVLMTNAGILIKLDGYNDKLPLLLEKLISKIINLEHDLRRRDVENALKRYIQSFNKLETDHFYQLDWHTQYLLHPASWANDVLINAGKRLQYDDTRKFLSRFFRRIFIRGFIHGNCTKQKATEIVDTVERLFQPSSGLLLQELVLRRRHVDIDGGSHFVYRVVNEEPKVYGYSAYFQLNTGALENVAGYVLNEHTTESCGQILLSQNQNDSATVQCQLENWSGVRGFIVSMRTNQYPSSTDTKVEKFLEKILKIFEDMMEQDFERYKRRVEKKFLPESSLAELCETYWYEITNRFYQFDRDEVEVEELRSLKKADMLAFLNEAFNVSSPRRRKLAVYVLPKQTKSTAIKKFPFGAINVVNPDTFKTDSSLLPFSVKPLPKPSDE